MFFLNRLLNQLFTLLFFPFRRLSPWVSMIWISLLTGLFLLAIYRLVSDQAGIKRTKDRIKGYLLELRLFSDDFLTTLHTQGNLLFWNLKYFLHALRPLAVMVVPLVFILSHLNLWFSYSPLQPNEATLLKVKLKEGYNPLMFEARIEPGEGFLVETPALRIEEEREISWRLRFFRPGHFSLLLHLNGHTIEKEAVVGSSSLTRLSLHRPSASFSGQLLHPGEKPLPSSSPVSSVSIVYPPRRLNFLGLRIHWLIAYFLLSIIAGLILKKPLKIEI